MLFITIQFIIFLFINKATNVAIYNPNKNINAAFTKLDLRFRISFINYCVCKQIILNLIKNRNKI